MAEEQQEFKKEAESLMQREAETQWKFRQLEEEHTKMSKTNEVLN